LELIRRGKVAVVDRELEVSGHAGGSALEPHFAVIVLRYSPLRAVGRGGLSQEAVPRPAKAECVYGAVHPVVHRPEQAGLLRLHVARASEVGREELLPIGDAIAVRVGVLPHFVRVRLHRQDRVRAERENEPWEHQLVDEDGVMFVGSIVVAILVHRDAADRGNQIDAIRRLNVAAELDDEHPSVAVERDLCRIFHDWFGHHRLHAVASRQPEPGGLFGRSQCAHRRLGGEVGVRIGRVGRIRGGAWTSSAGWRLNRSASAVLCARDERD
jgi:hypothetical protein